jgi:hypothetical protein
MENALNVLMAMNQTMLENAKRANEAIHLFI